MSVQLDSSFQSLNTAQTDCAPKYKCRVKWLESKGATLIVVWSFLIGSVFHMLMSGYKVNSDSTPTIQYTGFILLGSTLLYPVGGWLADRRLGKYAVVKYSTWIMWIGTLFLTLNEILFFTIDSYKVHPRVNDWVSRVLSLIMAIGLGGFQSNIVQLGIDQLQDASATEITSFLMWYTLTFFSSSVTLHFASDCVDIRYVTFIKPFIVVLLLTIAIYLEFIFRENLVKEHVAGLSLYSILRIITYVIRNRKVKHMFTDDGESVPLFDVGKHQYGGPFTAQQVGNVRTFVWMTAVIASFATICGVHIPLNYADDKALYNTFPDEAAGKSLSTCFDELSVHYFSYLLTTVVMLLYEFLIYPMFHRCIPTLSITNKFLLGATLTLLWIISIQVIETVSYLNGFYSGSCIFRESVKNKMSYKWFIIPKLIHGFASFFLILSLFEFIWSQAPSTMKGMILGLGYAFLGLCVLVHTAIASPFIFRNSISWTKIKLTCQIWYFLMEGLIVLFTLIIIAIVIQRYKKRNNQIY